MLRHIARVAATGFSFVVFGLGCALLVLIVFPLAWLLTIFMQSRTIVYRRIISFTFRFFTRMMRALGLLTFEFKDLERIPGDCLIVANHPSLIDVVILLGWVRDANCVVKGALFRNPFIVGPVTAAGYVNNDAPNLVDECIARLSEGFPLLIFPEGTRTKPGEEIRMLRGAANIALEAGVPVCPVSIDMRPVSLSKGDHWWTVPKVTPHYEITVEPVWGIDKYLAGNELRSKQARHLTRDLEAFYQARVGS